MAAVIKNFWTAVNSGTSVSLTIPARTVHDSLLFIVMGKDDDVGAALSTDYAKDFWRLVRREFAGTAATIQFYIKSNREKYDIASKEYDSTLPKMSAGFYTTSWYYGQFAASGTRFYMMDYSLDRINQFNVFPAYDLSSLDGSTPDKTYSPGNVNPYGNYITPDGTKMFWVESVDAKVYSRDLSVPFEIDSSSNEQSYNLPNSSGHTQGRNIHFSENGYFAYLIDYSDGIHTYELVSAFDLSAIATDYGTLSGGSIHGMYISDNGKYLVYMQSDDFDLYYLDTPFVANSGRYISNNWTCDKVFAPMDPKFKTFITFSGTILSTYGMQSYAETITLTGDSEEYSLAVIEVVGLLESIYPYGSLPTQTDASASVLIDSVAQDEERFQLISFVVDGDSTPYVYDVLTTEIVTVQSSGGSGSVGIGIAHVTSLSANNYTFTLDSSDDWRSIGDYYSLAPPPTADIAVSADLKLTATVNMITVPANAVFMTATAIADFRPGASYSAAMSVSASATFFIMYPLIVSDYRWQYDGDTEADTPDWIAPINTPVYYEYGAQAKIDMAAASIHKNYGVSLNYFYYYTAKARFLVKNTTTVPYSLRPIARLKTSEIENNTNLEQLWLHPRASCIIQTKDSTALAHADSSRSMLIPPYRDGELDNISTVFISSNYTSRYIGIFVFNYKSLDGTKVYSIVASNTTDILDHALFTFNNTSKSFEIVSGFSFPSKEDLFYTKGIIFDEDPNALWTARLDSTANAVKFLKSTDDITWAFDVSKQFSPGWRPEYFGNTIWRSTTEAYFTIVDFDDGYRPLYLCIWNGSSWTKRDVGFVNSGKRHMLFEHPTDSDVLVIASTLTDNFAQYRISTNTFFGLASKSSAARFNFNFKNGKLYCSLEDYSGVTYYDYTRVTIVYDLTTYAITTDSYSNEFIDESYAWRAPDVDHRTSLRNVYFPNTYYNTQVGFSSDIRIPLYVSSISGSTPLSSDEILKPTIIPTTGGEKSDVVVDGLGPVLIEGLFDSTTDPSFSHNADRTQPMLIGYDSGNNAVKILAVYFREMGSSGGEGQMKIVELEVPYENRNASTQKIGTGTYNAVNTAILREGYADDDICILAPNSEVEVVVPVTFYFYNGSASIDLYHHVRLFGDNINPHNSIAAPISYDTNASVSFGKLDIHAEATFSLVFNFNSVDFQATATMTADGGTGRYSNMKCRSTSELTAIAASADLQIVMFDWVAGDQTPTVTHDPSNIVGKDYDYDIYEYEGTNWPFRLDDFLDFYQPVHVRWWIRNLSGITKNIFPRVQYNIDEAGWQDIEPYGLRTPPSSTTPFALDNWRGAEYASTSQSVDNEYSSKDWFAGSSLGWIDFGTYMRLFCNSREQDTGYYKIFYTDFTKATGLFSTVTRISEGTDLNGYNGGDDSYAHSPNIDTDGVNFLLCTGVDGNNIYDIKVVNYDHTLEELTMLEIPVPSGGTQETFAPTVVETTGGDIVALASIRNISNSTFISHYSSGSFNTGSYISIPGYSMADIYIAVFYPDPLINQIQVLFWDRTGGTAAADLYRTEYNPTTKTFSTPAFMSTAASLGIATITSSLHGAYIRPTFYDSSAGIVHMFLTGTTSGQFTPAYYKISAAAWYVINPYWTLSQNNIIRIHQQKDGEYLVLQGTTGSTVLIKEDIDKDYYRLYSGRATDSYIVFYFESDNESAKAIYSFWDDVNKLYKHFVIWAPGEFFGGWTNLIFKVVKYPNKKFDVTDLAQELSIGSYVTPNRSMLTLHTTPYDTLTLPHDSSVELSINLALYRNFATSTAWSKTVSTKIELRILDDSTPIDYRDRYFTINFIPTVDHTGKLDISASADMAAKGTKITNDPGAGQLSLIATATMTAVGTIPGTETGNADWYAYAHVAFSGEKVSHAILQVRSTAVFNAEAIAFYSGALSVTGYAQSAFSGVSTLTGVLDIQASASLDLVGSRDRATTVAFSAQAVFDQSATYTANGRLDLQSRADISIVGFRIRHDSMSIRAKSYMNVKSLNIANAVLDLSCSAYFDLAGRRDARAEVSFSGIGTFDLSAARTSNGRFDVLATSTVLFSPINIGAAVASWDCVALFNGALHYNDNRDLALFDSYIERVVSISLFNAEHEYNQKLGITNLYSLGIQYTHALDDVITPVVKSVLPIKQISGFNLKLTEQDDVITFNEYFSRNNSFNMDVDSQVLFTAVCTKVAIFSAAVTLDEDRVINLG